MSISPAARSACFRPHEFALPRAVSPRAGLPTCDPRSGSGPRRLTGGAALDTLDRADTLFRTRVVAIVSIRITREQIESIRYHTHQPTLVEAMQRLDPNRFRGLGPERTRAFVRHGWETAQRLGLLYVNDAGYVLFLMTFLGSHFLDDFRHADLARILQEPDPRDPPGLDTRIRRAREAFIAFGDRRIGPKATIYRADVGRFSAWLARTDKLAADELLAVLPRCHEGMQVHLTEPQKWILLAEAQASADALGLDQEDGDATALALRWWLGVRFEADPLYPWVRDVTSRESQPEARTRALRDYAMRRLSTVMRGRADV